MSEIRPMVITDESNGEKYTLEFDVKSIKFAEDNGFDIRTVSYKLLTGVQELFFYAFRKHHRYMKRDETDALLERLRPYPDGFVAKLIELYGAPLAEKEPDPFVKIEM